VARRLTEPLGLNFQPFVKERMNSNTNPQPRKPVHRIDARLGFIVIFVVAWLAGCGGGGGGETAAMPIPTPPTVICNPSAIAGIAPTYNGKKTLTICPNVFVDATTSAAEQVAISVTIEKALARNKIFYSSLVTTPPDVIVCKTVECGIYFAGPSLRNVALAPNTFVSGGIYVAPRATVILTGIAPDNENVLTHEVSHVELASRIGSGQVPAWFNEGLATMIGGAPDCIGVNSKAFTDLRQVDSQQTWNTQTGSTAVFLPAYCQARAEVAAWSAARAAGAIVSLLAAVKSSTPFYTAYGPFLTQ
jgi:hypothetical protein